MNEHIARKAGNAVVWRAFELLGTRFISLTRTLVLAVLLVPEDFGLVAIAAVAINMLMSLTEFGMVQALVQQGEAGESHYHTAWTVRVVRALLVAGLVVVLAPWIASAFGEPRSINVMRALAFCPLLEGLGSIRVAHLTRRLRFKQLATKSLAGASFDLIVAIALAQSLGVWALVAGALAGATAETVISYVIAPYRPKFLLQTSSAGPLFRFGRWIFLTTVLSVAGSAALRMIISRQLGSVQLGLFYLAAKVALLPNDTLSRILGDVAFPVHARLKHDAKQAAKVVHASFMSMLAILLPVYTIMIALAPSMAKKVLPDCWLGTELIIQLMAISGLIGIVADAVNPMLEGRGQPNKVSLLFGLRTAVILALAPTLSVDYGLVGAVVALLISEVIVQIVAAAFAQKALLHPFAGLASRTLAIGFASLLGAGVGLAIDGMSSGILGFVVAIGTSLALSTSLFWFFDRSFQLGVTEDLQQIFPELAQLFPKLFAPTSTLGRSQM